MSNTVFSNLKGTNQLDFGGRYHRRQFYINLAIFLLPWFFAGCSNTKYLQADEALLVKNKVESVGPLADSLDSDVKDDLYSIIQQRPNTKWLGMFKLKLALYNRMPKKRGKGWISKNLHEPPVIYDEDNAETVARLMENFLFNQGYFHARVEDTFSVKKKKATGIYKVSPGRLYSIDSIVYQLYDPTLQDVANRHYDERLLVAPMRYNSRTLKRERSRLERLMKRYGYYSFSKEYIFYEIDSSQGPRNLTVVVKVKPPFGDSDHKRYRINDVYFDIYSKETSTLDSTTVQEFGGYIFRGEVDRYLDTIFTAASLLRPGNYYDIRNQEYTLRKLNLLGVFKFIKLSVNTVIVDGEELLDFHFQLTPSQKQEIRLSLEASTSSDNFLGTNFLAEYKRKNIFRNADQLSLSLTTGLETQLESSNRSLYINTLDVGGHIQWTFPRLLVPFVGSISRYYIPTTRFNFSMSYQDRLDYFSLFSTEFEYGVKWNQSNLDAVNYMYHDVAITKLSFVRLLNPSDSFQDVLDANPLLLNSFKNELILGPQYTFTYFNNQQGTKKSSFTFKGQLEVAGSGLYGINKLQGLTGTNNEVGGTEYAQFTKVTTDFRFIHKFTDEFLIASRAFAGIGVPYGNSTVLPYIRQFYIGGSTSVRAWRIRSLGPGSYLSPDAGTTQQYLDQTGDVKLESNIELRYPLFSYFHGAVFADAGNIWTLENDTSRTGGQFNFNSFIPELGFGAGIGLRADFSYFVIRLDVATPIYNPAETSGNRWIHENIMFKDRDWRSDNIVYNFAIGYPF